MNGNNYNVWIQGFCMIHTRDTTHLQEFINQYDSFNNYRDSTIFHNIVAYTLYQSAKISPSSPPVMNSTGNP